MTLEALSKIGHVALVRCEHCGSRRMSTSMRELRAALQDEPTPLLARAVQQLRRMYGRDARLFVCSACSCVTGDLRNHSH